MSESDIQDQSKLAIPEETSAEIHQDRRLMIIAIISGLFVLAALVFAVIFLVGNPDKTQVVRDIFIIFMAIESLFIGMALIILIVQLSRLSALIENEVKPLLDSSTDTVNTLRGTTIFLSSNLVKPVIKVNSFIAAIRHALKFLGSRSVK